MTNLNLTANGKAQELILTYLQENASEVLAEKINNGVPVEKNGKTFISKKDLNGFMAFANGEARKLAEKGANSACVEDSVVYGWAIHYFEEDSLVGKLFNEDGSEYKPEPKTKPKATPTVPYTLPKPKPEPQLSLFDMLSEKPAESPVEDDDEDDEENDGEVLNADYTPEESEEIHDEEPKKGSPMYQRYLAVKEKYNDGIVLYRLGDFYEMFGGDATTAANELNLTLTGKDCGLKERVPMAGIPFHAADVYISKLVSRGYKVIVAESLDDKTERTVERVIKPNPSAPLKLVDEETGEILSETEMQKFDGDIEEPEELPTVSKLLEGVDLGDDQDEPDDDTPPYSPTSFDTKSKNACLQEHFRDDDQTYCETLSNTFDKETMIYLYDLLDGKLDIA